MSGYRETLAVPGLTALLGVSFIARTAITAAVTALTMYVVLDLNMSYAAAGYVAAALTVGLALGGPLLGRLADRRGVRLVLLVSTAAQAVFWLSVPYLPFASLLPAVFMAGLLMVPAQSVTRQTITAMTKVEQRRAAFTLESVQGEVSYMVGPAVVILCAANASPTTALWALGAGIIAGGTGIVLLDPQLRAVDEAKTVAASRWREWLGAEMAAVLTMALGTTTLLSGVDLAIVAVLEESGQVQWAAVVMAALGVASVAGGLICGAARPLPPWLLLVLLGLVTIPVGLAHDWRWLCVASIGTGFFAAPTLSAVADTVSRLAPAGAWGEVTGLQTAALSAGFALGTPSAGTAVDAFGPTAGFVAVGLVALTAALMGHLLSGRALRAEVTRT
ncbi:MFS transporter [Streptomyces sp. NPDC001665]